MRRPGGDPGLYGDTALLITVDVFAPPNICPPFCYCFFKLVGELELTIFVDVLAMVVVFVACFGEGEPFTFTVLRLTIETLYFTWRGGEGDADYFYFKAYSFYCFYPNVSRVFSSDSFYYY